MATFPLLIVHFLFKVNRVQAVDDIDNLYKIHENMTTNADCIAYMPYIQNFDTLSWRPGKYEIVPEILKNKVDRFFSRPNEGEGFVIKSCLYSMLHILLRADN